MNKIGIFHWYGYVEPFEQRIKQIKETGYDYLMLWWEDETYPRFLDRRELIKIVGSYDLNLDNVHLPFNNINDLWLEGSDRQIRIDEIKRFLNECRECGAETVVLHASSGKNISLNNSLGFKSFNEITKETENIKLKLAIENTQMQSSLKFVLDEFKSEYVGLCYDSSHDFVQGQSSGDILDNYKDRLFCVHLSDCDGISDKHWTPGKGIVNWKRIIKVIKNTDCKSFSMETYPSDEEKNLTAKDFLYKAKDSLIKVL